MSSCKPCCSGCAWRIVDVSKPKATEELPIEPPQPEPPQPEPPQPELPYDEYVMDV